MKAQGQTGSATHGMLQLLHDLGGNARASEINKYFPFAFNKRGTFQGLIDKEFVAQPNGPRTPYHITRDGEEELEARGPYLAEHFNHKATELPWKEVSNA